MTLEKQNRLKQGFDGLSGSDYVAERMKVSALYGASPQEKIKFIAACSPKPLTVEHMLGLLDLADQELDTRIVGIEDWYQSRQERPSLETFMVEEIEDIIVRIKNNMQPG